MGERPPQGQKRAQATPDAAATLEVSPSSGVLGLICERKDGRHSRRNPASTILIATSNLTEEQKATAISSEKKLSSHSSGLAWLLVQLPTHNPQDTVQEWLVVKACDAVYKNTVEGVAEIKGVVEAVAMRASSVMCLAR
ncbi:hypothetical protein PC116_g24465 [Phytophthora cactorum]|uniref:Uncharacterized protein n=1 Tax=Phytophthora cactorum TaxID=29920 RepID=A0A8T1JUG4_9STRA|nr:hypothetical protein PC112_g10997 [Phytophthora cactorum]KAG2832488.1 hypothetical protein PC111_g6572 [Phytophthora cactorum]KAG2856562.1 hypothetical protein PC113_g11474 [Phytophthora cactorum]KAG2879574.1 hypothetical protein PC114_g22504 [Phytophthora cactorum]KAG2899243.1 hypothetical protein PC117_g22318 [Phytophthora cactorum]